MALEVKKLSTSLGSFLSRIFSVVLLSVAAIGTIFLSIPPDPESYMAASLQQVRLLREEEGPRIIVIGGSNVAFGIDAALMQSELSIPVINDGLHVRLGGAPLSELQQYIHEGDVIILSLEYAFFTSEKYLHGYPDILSDWIEYDPYRTRYVSYSLGEIMQIYHVMLQRKINRSLDTYLHSGSLNESRSIYLAHNFDTNGDFIGHLYLDPEDPKKIISDAYTVTNLFEEAFLFLNEFKRRANDKGATVFFEAPASRETNCLATGKNNLMNFYKILEEKTFIPILTDLDHLCMDDKYFFDTDHHLTAEGREIRTKNLIENILKVNKTLRVNQP